MTGVWQEVQPEDLASEWRSGTGATAQPWEYLEVASSGDGRRDGDGRSGETSGSLATLLDHFAAEGWDLAGVQWTPGTPAPLGPPRLIFKRQARA